MTVGSRAEVFHGNANATSGGLTKKDLMMKDGTTGTVIIGDVNGILVDSIRIHSRLIGIEMDTNYILILIQHGRRR